MRPLHHLLMLALFITGSAAAAQNTSLQGRAQLSLNPGYAAQSHSVWAMGRTGLGAHTDCLWGGYFNDQASVTLTLTAPLDTLGIVVTAGIDTRLLIAYPNGTWYCNDDFIGDNPGVDLTQLPAGRYQLLIGTNQGNPNGTTLVEATITFAP